MTRFENLRTRLNVTRPERDLHSRLGLTAEATDQDVEAAHKELVKFLKGAPNGLSRWAQNEIASVDEAYELLTAPAPATSTRGNPRLKRAAAAVLAIGATVGVIIGVYNMGAEETGSSANQKVAAQTKNLSSADQAQVVRLMDKVQANPKDVASLSKLGDIYYAAGDYNAAGGWMGQAVAADPKNVTARLALGAAKFNLGDAADARRQWLRVIEIDPKNVEAYYDLGFLYLSKKPPDMAAARKAWRKVVALDPGSEIAKSVATHLKGLKESPSDNPAGNTGVPADPTTDRK